MSADILQDSTAAISNTKYQSIISSLANPETLVDSRLYQVTATAHAALVEIQDEYLQLEHEVAVLDKTYKNRGNARKLLEPAKYREKNDKRILDLVQRILKGEDAKISLQPDAAEEILSGQENSPSSSLTPKAVKALSPRKCVVEYKGDVSSDKEPSPPKASPEAFCKPSLPKKVTKDDLAIDMNAEHTTAATLKRQRKPRTFLYTSTEAPAPAHDVQPSTTTTTSSSSLSSPTKKRKRENASNNDNAQARALDLCSERPAPDHGEECCEKQSTTSTALAATTPNPVRGEAMRKAWAKRQLAGTNGRHGGAPRDKLAKHNHAQKVKAEMERREERKSMLA